MLENCKIKFIELINLFTLPDPASPQITTGMFARTLKRINAILFIKLSQDNTYSGRPN